MPSSYWVLSETTQPLRFNKHHLNTKRSQQLPTSSDQLDTGFALRPTMLPHSLETTYCPNHHFQRILAPVSFKIGFKSGCEVIFQWCSVFSERFRGTVSRVLRWRSRQRGRRTRVDPQLSQCVLIDNNSEYAVACSEDVGRVWDKLRDC